MAIKDTNIQKLIINRLTQEKYEELLASDQINDNELYITDSSAESEYSKEEVDVLLSEKANLSDTYTKTEVDEKISDLNIPTQVSQLTNDLGFITATEIENKANVSYVDEQLNKKADKTDIPSLVSQLTNDVGYITQHQDISGKADITYVNERLELKADKSDTYTKTEVDSLLENFEPIGETLPSQADNAGKFLTTDGTSASWDSIGKFTDNIDSVSLDLNKVIINRITQSEYNILAENGQLKEDEIYVTDAEAYTKAEVDELLSSQKSFVGDEITVITTEDDKAQAIGVIEKNKSNPKYDWIGTLAEYQSQAVATNHPDWVCYITDDNTAAAYEAYSKTETDELLNGIEEVVETKLDDKHRTNCITEIPQDIKLELNEVVEYYAWQPDDIHEADVYTKTPTIQVGTQLYNYYYYEAIDTISIVNSETSFTHGGLTYTRHSALDETARKLILKAGSKVWIPYGTTEVYQVGDTDAYNHTVVDTSWDGSKFFYAIETTGDVSFPSGSPAVSTSNRVVSYNVAIDAFGWVSTSGNISGTSTDVLTTGLMYYNTTRNIIRVNNATSGNIYSLPFCLIGPVATAGVVDTLDQTFNGFGFMGYATYTLPGLTYLVPNGFNEDGTLRNTKIVTNKVLVIEKDSSINSREFVPLFLSVDSYVFPRGFDYTFSKTGKTYNNYYDSSTNKIYYNGNSTTYTEYAHTFLGYANVDSSGRYTSIKDATVFNPLTIRDKQTLTNLPAPSTTYVNLTLGATGTQYTAPATGWFSLAAQGNDIRLWCFTHGQCCGKYSANFASMLSVFVKKGDVLTLQYASCDISASWCYFRFVYAEGSL